VLRFSPTAWAKLLYFRDRTDNEVGGFGITRADDLLYVEEFLTVCQEVTCVSVKFDDQAVADFFETQVDLGRRPEQFARLWLHSHPGNSPEPSGTDQDTFARVFGGCQWALMFIIAQSDACHARLDFNIGPGGQVLIPVAVDYRRPFGPSSQEAWEAEYRDHVIAASWPDNPPPTPPENPPLPDLGSYGLPYDFLDEFEAMEPAERQFVLDELAARPELWDEQEVMQL